MGNHNSHGTRPSLNQQQQLHQQWAHSFPRDLQRVPHLKVLPEDGLSQRLRSTDNGAILTAEGTIRGRRNSFRTRDLDDPQEHVGVYRTRSIHEAHHNFGEFQRPHQMYRDDSQFAMQAKRFGSEPDLRIPNTNNHSASNIEGFGAKSRISRGRKKYKAPAPPLVGSTGEGSSPDSYHWELTSGGDTSDSAAPQRKLRLFKTRAETHRHSMQLNGRTSNEYKEDIREKSHLPIIRTNGHNNSNDVIFDSRNSHIRNRNSLDLEKREERYTRSSERYEDKNDGGVLIRSRDREVDVRKSHRNSAPPVMHRSLSSPEFQAELRAVTQKLRVIDRSKFEPIENKPLEKISENKNRNIKDVKNRRKAPDTKQTKSRETKESKMITMDHHNILAKQRLIKGFKENIEKKQTEEHGKEDNRSKYNRTLSQESETTENISRGQASGKESTPEQSPTRKTEVRKTSDEFKTPAKTFYFGMDTVDSTMPAQETAKLPNGNEKLPPYILDKPTQVPIISPYKIQRQSSSESALSSEPDLDDTQTNSQHDISMHLRPTLPKKQLDIPRFSPATAWRLLSIVDTTNQNNHLHDNDEVPVLIEERIERLARPTPNIPLLGQRSSHDKSGDSGISGDAGPALMEDISDPPLPPIPHSKNQHSPPTTRPPIVAWTPQQDLEEEASSSDGGLDILKDTPTDVKFHARNHVFSLSLPRESHLAQYAESDKVARSSQGFNSLQKLRRSLGAALSHKTRISGESPTDVDDNWFLSTSAPNSLNHNSPMYRLSRTHSEDDEKHMTLDKEPTMLKSPSYTYLANGGHVMYLPSIEPEKPEKSTNYNNDEMMSKVELRSKNRYSENNKYRNERGQSIEIPCRKEFGLALKRMPISKSCENISNEMKQINRTPSPTRKQQSHVLDMIEKKQNKAGKMKRFTFQSTVRQIERKRIAERLSKEAERKERQRKSELEAMRRVEEEFQKKRAREKASIRQQLRLYSLDENNKNQSGNWEESQLRSEPDGAVSSSPAPSPTNHNQKLFAKSKDTKTPYISKLVEQKMSKSQRERERSNNMENMSRSSKRSDNFESNHKPSPEVSKRIIKNDHRSSPIARGSDDGRIKTEILSEYRQPTREYRDYRGLSTRISNTLDSPIEHQTTVHPQVVYNMPKASHGKSYHEVEGSVSPHSDNYRRDFAHGAVPTSSDSELSQPNTRSHSPRHLPRLRARSASPEFETEANQINITPTTSDEYDLENTHSSTIIEKSTENNIMDDENEKLDINEFIQSKNNNVMVSETFTYFNPQPFVAGKCFKPVTFQAK
ncbi:uncharacterized protein LOC123294216 isoform X2 [Chrysoperla carnea]|uniref:uncharacterized protein LOC123294216 isoform X2 n=1 Tax=Chrysoperla carnea TaxID=189513 RepID=UPI001D085DF3|nr:uncharacterized protein LOC123294216 isoform X2 [Chrysoperla carnea]